MAAILLLYLVLLTSSTPCELILIELQGQLAMISSPRLG